MALLAAECALKAALMHGFQLNTTDDADEIQTRRWFKGKIGHELSVLWNDQPAGHRTQATAQQDIAVCELSQADPYSYRYGQRKPIRIHAEPFVEHSEKLVQWTVQIMGLSS